jgi:hypothetical protein
MIGESIPADSDRKYPRAWRWDEDGLTVSGTYVRVDEAATEYGLKAMLVLRVGNEEVAIWLAQALRSQIAKELSRRGSDDFEAGEAMTVTRGTEQKESSAGRSYWPFTVTFADAPRRAVAEILGLGQAAKSAGDLPF